MPRPAPEPQRRSRQPGSPSRGPPRRARCVSCGPPAPTREPGPSGRRRACSARPPRRASHSEGSFPQRGPPLPLGPAATALRIRHREEGRGGGPCRWGSFLTGRCRAAPPIHGVRAPERIAGSSRAAHGTPAQRRPHQRPVAQLQPRRGALISAAMLGYGWSGRDERPRLNPRRHSFQQDPQRSGNLWGQLGRRHQITNSLL
ncbi:hypothetical protein NDU88_006164 [Pleurodeles waltl]|uniref:Uncharacterized protein n=1 Tax=Pleurodeles waltl TaxID=8319 RepID=A0AAV7TZB9_PLEWA|nr:hypothetical protein NDU88_006164 [Pleurodeles waltl]